MSDNWTFEIDKTIASRLHNTALRATNKALGRAKLVARGGMPVDTSSMKNSSRNIYAVPLSAFSQGDLTTSELIVGGVDFRGSIMPETGKPGKFVDYAIYQEYKHLFLETAMAGVPFDIYRYLPRELK